MARGINGIDIFGNPRLKSRILELLQHQKEIVGIPVYAWCIMDSHYHLVLQNHDGRMSEFMKRVNGPFGQYFRFITDSRGVVFQNRFKSLLIQDDKYLYRVIRYVLNNPVKARLVKDMRSYKWSSASLYYQELKDKPDAIRFVEILYGGKNHLFEEEISIDDELPVFKTDMGEYIGDESFADRAIHLADRRNKSWSKEHRRKNESHIQPFGAAENEFYKRFKIYPHNLDCRCVQGKRLRAQWLVWLRDRCGLSYREISMMDLFAELKTSSLGAIYRNARKRKLHE